MSQDTRSAFDHLFQSAKDEVWFEGPSPARVREIMGEVIRNIETASDLRRFEHIYGHSKLDRFRGEIEHEYGGELAALRERFAAPAAC